MKQQRKLETTVEHKTAADSHGLQNIDNNTTSSLSPLFNVPTHDELVKYVDSFLEETGIKPSAFGRKFLNDSGSIPRLREGTDPRLSTVRKICDAIEKTKKDQVLKKKLQEMME